MIKQAVILAAGEGKRMRPLTEEIPKPLIEVAGKPLIDYTLNNLKAVGVDEVIIIVGYLKEKIIDHLSSYTDMKIDFVVQDKKRGTAHAIGLSKPYITGDFLVLNGDVVLQTQALVDLVSNHVDNEVSIMCEEVEDARPYGVLMLEDTLVTNIIEKPENPPCNIVNAGSYIFPKRIFDAIDQTELSQRGELEIVDSINILINQGLRVRSNLYENPRAEITKPSDIEKATDWIRKNY
jgi:UDP-N-acetylglucosamine diphosphorylase / glucose-1-phosphate thymidylyltransferase / UDP-N-acetylgalactosamine diphosphorylase / glucosamine-1-phosphate N-acetyltransferase / galactosamine-1-phosphate N-acetyltransferase